MQLVHVGFGNIIAVNRVVALMNPESAPIKRLVREAREHSTLVDLTSGRKTKSVIVLDSGHVVLAAIQPETIAGRATQHKEAVVDLVRS